MNAGVSAKRGRKYDEVIAGARKVFLRDGYDGAIVDEIAREASVSKATVYSYFADKRLLFLQVAQTEIDMIAQHATQTIDRTAPARDVLLQAARTIVAYNTSPMGLAVFRMCVAEAERFPELSRAYYAAGTELAQRELCDFFDEAIARGELAIPDTLRAANQFLELCRADLHIRMLLRVSDRVDPAEAAALADDAVDLFLARYATGRIPAVQRVGGRP